MENIKVTGLVGTWYTVETGDYQGEKVFLIESELYGNDVPHAIITEQGELILDNAPNDFSDLEDL